MGLMGATEVSMPLDGNRRFGRTKGPVFLLNEARFYTSTNGGIHVAQRGHPSADASAVFGRSDARGLLAAKASGQSASFQYC